MAIKHTETVTSLAGDIGSADIVPRIDRALQERKEDYIQEVSALLHIRNAAVLLHGSDVSPPDLSIVIDVRGETGTNKGENLAPPIATMDELISLYTSDETSPYRRISYSTRLNYDSNLNRLRTDIGSVKLATITSQLIKSWHDGWSADGKLPMAHALITMLRGIVNYGAEHRADPECNRISSVLHRMTFPPPKGQNRNAPPPERLTQQHVQAIIDRANEFGRASVALAQAFQFECQLTQKNTIGEWVPLAEEQSSDIIDGDKKWVRGLRWEEIDDDFTLERIVYGGKSIIFDLSKCPFVKTQLSHMLGERDFRRSNFPEQGPVIVSEASNKPWAHYEFRRIWRKIARLAGVPDTIRNADSRTTDRAKRSGGSDIYDEAEDETIRASDAETSEARH
jgi:hypothetical protein